MGFTGEARVTSREMHVTVGRKWSSNETQFCKRELPGDHASFTLGILVTSSLVVAAGPVLLE